MAGSDCSAGAGLQADLKTFSRFGVYGLTTVTCVVSEVPNHVAAVENVSVDLVRSQLDLLLRSYPVAAAKSGMIPTAAMFEAIAGLWSALDAPPRLVVDPVMISGGGTPLITSDAVMAMKGLWLPLATLVTPNSWELEVLTGRKVGSISQQRDAAKALGDVCGAAVLAKGGHIDSEDVVDVLWTGRDYMELCKPRLEGGGLHGTGCTLSAAIVSALALGDSLETAVRRGEEFLHGAILDRLSWMGRDLDALNTLPPC